MKTIIDTYDTSKTVDIDFVKDGNHLEISTTDNKRYVTITINDKSATVRLVEISKALIAF
jgi:hypothetical protein